MTTIKVCRDCGLGKPATPEFFSRSRAAKDGLVPRCKGCMSARWKRLYKERHEHYVARGVAKTKARRVERPEYDRRIAREYKRKKFADPAFYRAYLNKGKEWRKANVERVKAYSCNSLDKKRYRSALREARQRRATVAWADQDAIKAIYAEAHRLTVETGIPHEVDHIVPLAGRNVCGFHVETNLQVVTAAFNRAKGNTFIDTS